MTRQERSMGDIFFAALFNPPATIAFRIHCPCDIYPYLLRDTLHLKSFRKPEFSSQYFFTQLGRSTQQFRSISSSQAGERKGGATQGYENEEKVGSDIGMGTYEYEKGRQDEVRCRMWGGGRGEYSGLKSRLGGREAQELNVIMH